MNKNNLILLFGIIITTTTIISLFVFNNQYNTNQIKNTKTTLSATIIAKDNNQITIQDQNNIIYTFNENLTNLELGSNIIIEYTGLLDKNKELQEVAIKNYNIIPVSNDNVLLETWQDNGIFSSYYKAAYKLVKNLTLEEKIAQLLLVRYPNTNQTEILKKYQFGGYLFFEKDFQNKTKLEVKNMINNLQNVTNIPILTAVDEEGGNVVRVSSNTNLIENKFHSPSTLYLTGGFDLIKEDTIKKSKFLKDLGLNLNLAPVVDVTTNTNAYMYDRTLKKDSATTSTYAQTVINASKNTGVSYTLKHFPGYGNNEDTHISSATDIRSYDEILKEDLPPFQAGINAGAEAVLISHNIITSIDSNNPASLSPTIHNLLRNQLNFTGIIIADNLDMNALSQITDKSVKAILAGNDLIITTDYQTDINSIKKAIQNGTIEEKTIDKLATRIIAWKFYKSLIFENQK